MPHLTETPDLTTLPGAPDYSVLLDAEIRAFIARTGSFYPPDTAGFTAPEQRRVYDRMAEAFHAGRPEGVAVAERVIVSGDTEIPVRRYTPRGTPGAQVVYYHGGGVVVGGLESHDDVCAEIAARTGFIVTSVDYRLAPEHRHPAAFEDALAAFRAVAGQSEVPVLLCGDSAGGNLAAATAHATREDQRRPAGQVLIYPGLGGDMSRGSYRTHAHAPMLTLADLYAYRDIRGAAADPGAPDPTLAPLSDTDFTGLPPTLALGAECDPLCDDCAAYAAAIRAAGGQAQAHVEKGLVHGHLRARHVSARAGESFSRVIAGLTSLAAGGLPPAG
ncbi:alpha/beta hydrolase [Paroceanicella profunda]|uniref:Alpha/beta hydrolase n=1 Tax=Paroceanicella profunda TaxID=2579971 RepID=A0A5B8FTQ6_9RHOB|nr:alpha/beta hydrolase [Paroceanicella profunda]QDL91755.1 alpha/beta hydrolase [Paroceanicella profunda]